jgi:GNAT superfamily N-acetyltransferase
MMVLDDFLDSYPALRAACDVLDYAPVINDTDGVRYEGISEGIPDAVKEEFVSRLEEVCGFPVTKAKCFLRLSTENGDSHHWVHHDASEGDFTAVVYLTRQEHCQGGTLFVRHRETGSERDIDVGIWERDTSVPEAWELVDGVQMAPNRAVLFDAGRLHAADPQQGFGHGASDGRLVLVCFFSVGAVILRPGTIHDIPDVLPLAREFWPHTWIGAEEFDDVLASELLEQSAYAGLLSVLQIGDKLGGFAFGDCGPLMGVKDVLIGQERAWWVSPRYRGQHNGVRLLNQLETQAKAAGIKYWLMSHMETSMPKQVASMYESMGYVKTETNYRRVL